MWDGIEFFVAAVALLGILIYYSRRIRQEELLRLQLERALETKAIVPRRPSRSPSYYHVLEYPLPVREKLLVRPQPSGVEPERTDPLESAVTETPEDTQEPSGSTQISKNKPKSSEEKRKTHKKKKSKRSRRSKHD